MKLAFITIMSIQVDMKWNFKHKWQNKFLLKFSYKKLLSAVLEDIEGWGSNVVFAQHLK